MSYIVGTSFPKEKLLTQILSGVLGLGLYRTTEACRKVGLGPDCKAKELTSSQWSALEDVINSLSVPTGVNLQRFRRDRVKRLSSIGAYRGLRHRRGLPVRGQRTHTNAKRRPILV